MKKTLIVALAGVLALGLFVFRKKSDAPAIAFAKVTRETIESTLSTNGKVEPNDYVEVRAEAAGLVRRVLVRLGDSVRAGQAVAEVSQPGVAEELQASEARLAQAQAALSALKAGGRDAQQAEIDGEVARLKSRRASEQQNLEALERLQRASAATGFDVEQARSGVKDLDLQFQALQARRMALVGRGDVDAAQARLKEAEAGVTLAKTHRGLSSMASPLGGVVYDLPVRAGTYLRPGDAVASVGRLDPVRVRVYVDEPELGRVAIGEAVRITWDALAGREWHGTVERRPTEVVALGSRQVGEVLCTVGNPDRDLTPGTNINAFILTKVAKDVLSVPKSTIRRDRGAGVYVLQPDNTVKWRAVRTGVSDALRVEVTGGLTEGDRVALPSELPIKDGMAVNPQQ